MHLGQLNLPSLFIHIYAQRKLIFISKLGKLNNDVTIDESLL